MTKDDLKLIVLQCEHQQDTTPEAVAGFALAYVDAKSTTWKELALPETVEEKIIEWGRIIKPKENKFGWRNIPVRIGNSTPPDPQLVPRMMENFSEKYWHAVVRHDELRPDNLYKEFEEIHPFRDGNGRAGHLLWAIAKRELEGEWPMTLPPDLWRTQEEAQEP